MEDRKDEVMELTNKIIKSLYRKDGKTSRRKLKQYNLSDEAINWGSLAAFEVKQDIDGTFVVFIDEAAPECSNFNYFIETELEKRGIKATIITEW